MLKKPVVTAIASDRDWIARSLSSIRSGFLTWAKSWRVIATHSSLSLTSKSPPPVKPEKSSLKYVVTRSSRDAYICRYSSNSCRISWRSLASIVWDLILSLEFVGVIIRVFRYKYHLIFTLLNVIVKAIVHTARHFFRSARNQSRYTGRVFRSREYGQCPAFPPHFPLGAQQQALHLHLPMIPMSTVRVLHPAQQAAMEHVPSILWCSCCTYECLLSLI